MGPGAFHRCHERDRTGEGAEALIGKYQHNIDAKGRLFIPAKFREQLGDVFYVTIGLDGCLSVYSDSKWEQLLEKYDTLSLAQARKVRVLFANAAECQPDSQGRILIPANLREYAALDREVVINGAVKSVELWTPDRWRAIEKAAMESDYLLETLTELEF